MKDIPEELPRIKVIMLGAPGSGKSTITEKFFESDF